MADMHAPPANPKGGIKGFQEHSQRVAQFYAKRRNQFEAIAKRHLEGIATWVSPVAG